MRLVDQFRVGVSRHGDLSLLLPTIKLPIGPRNQQKVVVRVWTLWSRFLLERFCWVMIPKGPSIARGGYAKNRSGT